MKINWDRWVNRDRGTLLFVGYAFFVCTIMVSYLDYAKPKIESTNDLIFIPGTFQGYSWIKFSKGSLLTFSLEDFSARFQIAADFYGILKKEKFKNIPQGKKIMVAIKMGDEAYLDSAEDRLLVYGVSSDEDTFLDYKDALNKYNDYTFVIGSGIFILLGSIFLYFGYKSKR